ncbi:TIMMDC1 [Branchiostoma lanceolatum]|uniref:Complex I assembly factor TIMMDC1, mitochondrial n=1 Tax=Branchiostoma lanceolatum TaxID=7740 RepID=A0A8J9ZYP1_BRALA|nr:TIMMDC1 [Branchiostoma lanceolatum]
MVFTHQQYFSISGSFVSARWLHSSRPRLLLRNTLSKPSHLVTLPDAKHSPKPSLQSLAFLRNFERVGVPSHHEYRTDKKFVLPSMSTLGELLKCAKNKLLLTTSVYAAEPSKVITPDQKENEVTNSPKKQTSDGPTNDAKEETAQNDDVVVPAWFLGTRPVPETGWERLKEVFEIKKDKKIYFEKYSREVTDWINVMAAGFLMGFVYGGVPAARHARLRYIELSHTQVYQGQRDAVGDAHKAAHRGFIRYGYRWGWRVAVFAGIFHGVSTCLAVYRDKDDALNYSAAGALAGGLYKITLGLRGIIGGSFLGILLGVPTGLLTQLGQTLQGETYVERRRRLRKDILELRQEEWKARLQLMDDFISETSSEEPSGIEPGTSGEASVSSDQPSGTEPSTSRSGEASSVSSDQPSGTEPSTPNQEMQLTNSEEQKKT